MNAIKAPLNGPHLILGIDPGVTGAMAILDPFKERIIDLFDMPLDQMQSSMKGKRVIDVYALAQRVEMFAKDIKFALIEDVHAMPNQGVVSMFSFGQSKGLVIGILASYMIPMHFVVPGVWKGMSGLGSEKKDALDRAKQLFPTVGDKLNDKKNHGRAEALLIANFGRRFL